MNKTIVTTDRETVRYREKGRIEEEKESYLHIKDRENKCRVLTQKENFLER